MKIQKLFAVLGYIYYKNYTDYCLLLLLTVFEQY